MTLERARQANAAGLRHHAGGDLHAALDCFLAAYALAALPQYANHYYKVGPQEYVSQTQSC